MSWLDTLEELRTRDYSKVPLSKRDETAREVVNVCSYATAVVAVSPLPFSDALLMLPIQSAMVMAVGHVYGREVGKAEAKDLIIEMGTVAGASFLARQGIKALLPVVGALLTIPAAFAANWAMGRVAMEYFRDPKASKESLRAVYAQAKQEGSSMFSKETFERFRKKHGEDIANMATAQTEASAAAGAEEAPARAAPVKKAIKKPATKTAKATKKSATAKGRRPAAR